jgi:7-keto-8-aminopelargonate synthetase-like enzyme
MNNFSNIAKVVALSNDGWDLAKENKLLDISVKHIDNGFLEDSDHHKFINMCSCSYLGLDVNPHIVNMASETLLSEGSVSLAVSRLRIRLSVLDRAEEGLTNLFDAKAFLTSSCSSATEGLLPLLASGVLTQGQRPLMIFDKFAHFSMNITKPICADETEVITCPHNDLNFIEDICKNNKNVAYVGDGTYSTGGVAPIKELLELQDKYGLFLYLDDAHSISVYGKKGRGYIRSNVDEVNNRTIIVASLGKAFGASGGIILLNKNIDHSLVERFGGPLGWSLGTNTATIGGVLGSIDVHNSKLLEELQIALKERLNYFDKRIETPFSGSISAIRMVPLVSREEALKCSKFLLKEGFYSTPLFFPIVPKDKPGLRIMLRADVNMEDIKRFCDLVVNLKK